MLEVKVLGFGPLLMELMSDSDIGGGLRRRSMAEMVDGRRRAWSGVLGLVSVRAVSISGLWGVDMLWNCDKNVSGACSVSPRPDLIKRFSEKIYPMLEF